ncbi:hypothetical protein LCGC14_1655490 [marine sediment metagenome]|uniref:Uncharacterized protein n=1 Tax=marine sediment metagenome TaxID=412755 RepID=A0A0F9HW87_9ZZZZ
MSDFDKPYGGAVDDDLDGTDNDTPITRGEMRELIKKLRSRIAHYPSAAPQACGGVEQEIRNIVYDNVAEDLESILEEA